MRLKEKIKRLEKLLRPLGNEFCACFQKYFDAQIRLVYENESFDEAKFTVPETDFCPKCRAEVSRRDTDLIKSLNEIYGESKV